MKADNSTFGRFKAGATDIVIDDVAAIAKEAGDAIMAIYNGTSEADWKKIAAVSYTHLTLPTIHSV